MALPSQSSSPAPSSGRTHAQPGARSLKVSPRGAVGAVVIACIIAFIAWGLGQLLPSSKQPPAGDSQSAGLIPESNTTADSSRPRPVDLTNPATQPSTTPAAANTATPPSTATTNIPGLLPQDPLTGSTAAAPVVVDPMQSLIADGDRALAAGKTLEARRTFNQALADSRTSDADKASLREKLASISADILFSQKIIPGDPLVEEYQVQGGDSYERIRKREQLAVDWRLLERINRTAANRLRVGQRIKLIRGPFHAVVDKSDFRLDIYAGSPDVPSDWVYIRSFNVGLGENDSTPIGTFAVKTGGKAVDPPWTNPRTGEHFDSKDPKNPIGTRWIGIRGLGSATAYSGYGIHGTIEPDSIGHQRSMGCVRLVNSDVEQIYELMVEEISVVKVQP